MQSFSSVSTKSSDPSTSGGITGHISTGSTIGSRTRLSSAGTVSTEHTGEQTSGAWNWNVGWPGNFSQVANYCWVIFEQVACCNITVKEHDNKILNCRFAYRPQKSYQRTNRAGKKIQISRQASHYFPQNNHMKFYFYQHTIQYRKRCFDRHLYYVKLWHHRKNPK